MSRRVGQYYAKKMGSTYKTTNPRIENWEKSGSSMMGWMSRLGSGLDVPFKSIALFACSWLMLEIGWPVLILLGVATAGSVWSVSSAIPFMFIVVYGIVMMSGSNLVRSLISHLTGQRDNLVKAIFRGYFWSLLSVGLVLIIHQYFHGTMPFLFIIPIVYLLPIEILGNTVPIPIPLGISGWYLDILVMIVVYVVGITGSCIGGIELLRYFVNSSNQRGTYHAILSVLLLAVFPAMNIQFSLVFLNSILDLYRRMILGV
ncbi:MAG: hypothetical protein ACXABY_09245 [Candidatus Thorarchaeota archaeon]|jgi:hypothetical protein